MLQLINEWALSIWPAVENDFAFALIGGGIVILAQLINAGFGIWHNVGLKEEELDIKYLLYTLAREIGLVVLLLGGITLAHMLAILAGMSILPGFEIGDVPTAALLAAYAYDVLGKAKNIWSNLLSIFNGNNNEAEDSNFEPDAKQEEGR